MRFYTLLGALWTLHLNLALTCYTFKLVPDLLHASSSIYLKNSETNEIDHYNVIEYVDWASNRSSLFLSDKLLEKNLIHYNELVSNSEVYYSVQRKFVAYDLYLERCIKAELSDWPLHSLRKFVINMVPADESVPEIIDVTLGPSSLLLAIEQNLASLKYRGSEFVEEKLQHMEVFSKLLDDDPGTFSHLFEDMLIRVMITKRKSRSLNNQNSLADVVNSEKNLFVESITVCKLTDNKELDSKCTEDKIYMHIDYQFVVPLKAKSLVGFSIEESPSLSTAPFAQPIGIGCGLEGFHFNHLKQFRAPTLQFTALYTTTNGPQEMSYVAFDGHNSIYRLDRFGRKSIYDVAHGYSYHEPVDSPINGDNRCVILESSIDTSVEITQRLLGIGYNGESAAYYLGSRQIEHTTYEVYEFEIKFNDLIQGKYNYPILLEANDYTMPPVNMRSGIRLFVVYYLLEYPNRIARDSSMGDSKHPTLKEPKFIELWKFNVVSKQRILINRLTFAEFSWSFDVKPSDQRDSIQLFSMDNCVSERSKQLQLRFKVSADKLNPQKTQDPSTIAHLRSNLNFLKQQLSAHLSRSLEIPLTNVAKTEVIFGEHGNLMVESKLIDLISGVKSDKPLPTVDLWMPLKMDKAIIKVLPNRQSFEDCKLESILEPQKNWLLYCEKKAICIISNREDYPSNEANMPDWYSAETQSAEYDKIQCAHYQINWAPRAREPEESILTRVQENRYKIESLKVNLQFEDYNELEDSWNTVDFSGSGHMVEITSYDSTGLYTKSLSSALTGLRYTTEIEEPTTFNWNSRVMIPTNKKVDPFTYCRIACDLDDLCSSYSVCSDGEEYTNDCILSPIRLSGNRIREIAKTLSKAQANSTSYDLIYETKLHSQLIRLRRDHHCGLHQKDMVSTFKSRLLSWSTLPSETEQQATREMDNTKPNLKEFKLSLEDCAELSHEREIETKENPFDATFIYCPIRSACYTNQDDSSSLGADSLEICYQYSKDYTQYYTKVPFSLMTVKSGVKPPVDQSEDSTKDAKTYSHVIEGLNPDRCAFDCNILNSGCLSFDVCNFGTDTSVCIHHSVRSLVSKVTDELPLLPIEKPFFTDDGLPIHQSISMATNMVCDHYFLSEENLKVRLNLIRQHQIKSAMSKSVEAAIIEADESKSASDLNKIFTEKDIDLNPKPKSGFAVNFVMILIGIFFGCVGVLYGSKLIEIVTKLSNSIQMNSHNREDTLNLARNMDL